jgi:acyl-CoA synthetase (AMP-forming)/AMP-acid ligase II
VRSASVFADYYKQHDKYEADSAATSTPSATSPTATTRATTYICDRKKDMIISGGMNIYPAEIEAALEAHPDIYEAAVFGIPSEEWGETVHAVVVRQPGSRPEADDVIAFAREHLASYKIPRSVSFLDELPKTGSGKILKRELRAPYWAGRRSGSARGPRGSAWAGPRRETAAGPGARRRPASRR